MRGETAQGTKLSDVDSSLQHECSQEIQDIPLHPPTDQPYGYLKAEVIKCTSASEPKHLHQLFTSEELGDRKLSQLLHHMRQLLGDNHLDERIRP